MSYPDQPLPDAPLAVVSMVAALDAELDRIHPGWRVKQPFLHFGDGTDAGYDRLARTKWLLKRRELLLHREFVNGGMVSRPRDWQVRIIPSPKSPSMCFAHPVIPHSVRRAMTTEPPPLGFAVGDPHPTGSAIPWGSP